MYISKTYQTGVMPEIDLLKLKSMTEEDWKRIVGRIPFLGNPFQNFRDYRDDANLGLTNIIFRQRVFKTAKEAGLSMLRTLNFMNYGKRIRKRSQAQETQ